jgi:hypothetical protein
MHTAPTRTNKMLDAKKDKWCTYNVTLRHVPVIILEMKNGLNSKFCECVSVDLIIQ